jgi:hypothetical protein
MNRAEVLRKLLRLGPLEPLHAQHVCGWPIDEFQAALAAAIESGWVRLARGGNQYTTRLVAA